MTDPSTVAPSPSPVAPLPTEVVEAIDSARRTLAARGIAHRLTEALGAPVSAALARLPMGFEERAARVAQRALRRALGAAMQTLDRRLTVRPRASARLHMGLVAGVGSLGGAVGLPGLAVELPLTTILMLRSIADIARAEGEDLDDPGARAAVLAVFALGTPKSGDATLDLGYYGVRVAIGQGLREAALALANGTSRTLVGGVVTRALEPVVARFSSVVAQKAVAQSVPVFGALGGAVINTIFIEHYNGLARAHFTLRRLEREYGLDAVRGRFEAQANE
ncbi:MAG: EcsC family protein [Planctomycetota bacterium]